MLLTTGGGLYRYQLHDEVQVLGFENECPLLRFIGSGQYASDLVGEKLSEPFVGAVLHQLFADLKLVVDFSMLVPNHKATARAQGQARVLAHVVPNYRLYLQGDFAEIGSQIDNLVQKLETALRANPHYRYARDLEQLGPIEVQVLTQKQPNAWQIYECEMMRRGVKLGNIKPKAIDGGLNWCDVLEQPRSAIS